ncbi:hypothetical protein GCM10011514_35710 [Emticicia aquatilis]|uniref:OB-fold nucleic acid binding domain-containing protein n=1 Tax=Emticicia aquatilis TaxID=1537369 RepID=A0A916YZH7_9BACT|nr:hypothetical protein [Emticicia aquatilis]GGD68461.1 hypothetical protein GCM10011514_35710 [Emticicia aquatilis]
MYKKTITFLFLIIGINSFAQNDTLKAEQAKNYLGKEVIIKGYITSTRLFDKDGKKTFLINLDKRYPENPLTVELYDAAYKALNLKAEIEERI